MAKGFIRRFKPFDILTEDEVNAIWEGIFEILEQTGIKFEGDSGRALKVFDRAGCKVDYDNKLVKFPRDIANDCLNKCPKSFLVKGRDSKDDVVIGEDKVFIQPGPGMKYIDIETFEPRLPTKKEFYDSVTVYDALPNLHIYHPLTPNSSFEGIPTAMGYLEVFAARVRNSTKPNEVGNPQPRADEFLLAVAKVAGINAIYLDGAAPPLVWSEPAINHLMSFIEAGFPIGCASGAIWGASSPATIAGSMISNNVEAMGPVLLAQLMRPGHPVMVSLFSTPQNMKNGSSLFGNIACALGNAAFHQVWRRYGVPTDTVEPGIPNSKVIDFQTGYEKGMLALAAAISGAQGIWIHGGVYGELTAHPIQAILDDDIAGMVGRFLEGVEVSNESLAVDLIKEIGNGPDFYLGKAHTRNWWAREQYMPATADTTTLAEWLEGGKKTTMDLAREKMEHILANHKVSIPLTTSQEEEIERILTEARNFYKKIGRY
jgi:trimethylamine--corrinoid protein Co-methyltransferase